MSNDGDGGGAYIGSRRPQALRPGRTVPKVEPPPPIPLRELDEFYIRLGRFIAEWGKFESALNALTVRFASAQMTGNTQILRALASGNTFERGKETLLMLMRVSGAEQPVFAAVESFFAHFKAIQETRNMIAHNAIIDKRPANDGTFTISTIASVKEIMKLQFRVVPIRCLSDMTEDLERGPPILWHRLEPVLFQRVAGFVAGPPPDLASWSFDPKVIKIQKRAGDNNVLRHTGKFGPFT